MVALPFRNNPAIFTRWSKEKKGSVKKAYYDININDKILKIHLREEKQTRNGNKVESPWHSWFEFPIDSQFAKDLKMFLDEHLGQQTPTKPIIVERSEKNG